MRCTTLMLSAALIVLGLTACGSQKEIPPVIASDPWVRTTDGSKMPKMTALFLNLANPSDNDVALTEANCGDVANRVELHVTVKKDGQMVMKKTDKIVVKKGSHEHLAPGGPHIMLMELNRKLPAGAQEVKCTLTFDSGQKIEVTAPVKAFTEEKDEYHTHES